MYWSRQYELKCISLVNTIVTEMYCSHQYPPIDPKKKFDTLNFTPTTSKNR